MKDNTERKQAAEALQIEKDRAQKYLDIAGVFIIAINTAGEVTLVNKKGCEVLGYKEKEIVGKNWFDNFLPARMRKETKAYSIKLIRGEIEPVEYHENLVLTKSGDERLIAWHNTLLKDDTGNIIGSLSSGEDITERKQAEEALQESEHRFREMADLLPQIVYETDVQGNLTFVNKQAFAIFGYSEDDFNKGINVLQTLIPEDRNRAKENIQRIMSGKPVENAEYTVVKKDGSTFPVLIYSNPVLKDNKPAGLRGIIVDITERKQAEEALWESGEKHRALYENAPLPYQSLDEDGCFIDVNPAWLKTLGYKREEVIGKRYADFLHPDWKSHFKKNFPTFKKCGYVHDVHYKVRHRKGYYLDILFEGCIGYKPDGSFKQTYCVFQDITARKQAEEDLRESEERYRSVFSEARDGITIVDMETGSITDCNPEFEKQTGRTLKQLKKMKIWEIITPEKASAAKKKFIEIQRSGSGGSADLEIQKPNGEIVFIDFRSKRLGIRGGKYTQSISRDITERKKADEERIALEQKAQVSSRLASVGEMAAGIAHEINNPLTAVIGFAHLLSQRDIPEDMRDEVKIIGDSAKRVSDIVKRMLAFARPQKSRQECIDIKQLIETTLALRAYELETNNIKLTTVLDPDLPLTLADGGQLQQVFINIIINAETEMKLAHGKGRLSVRAEKVGDTIRISFKDDGPGITEENMAKLFNPFFTTREVGQGTGLGLSVCHGIIKEHKGQLYAESELGKGATFIVELPIVAEEKQLGLAELATEEAEAPKGKILVVDDEPTVREFLTKLLVGKGHEVDSVGSASDALAMIKSERYGVILLDIKMPGMSGNELYKRVQKIAKSLAKRIVFVTGDVMGIDTMDFLSKTGAHYISKPINVEDLMKAINEILG